MAAERRVRLFKNGRSQALRIPKEYRLDADEVIVRQDPAGRLIVEPVDASGLLATLSQLPVLAEPFPDVDDTLPSVEDPPV